MNVTKNYSHQIPDFSFKMQKKSISAGLRADPTGELTALPKAQAGFGEREWERNEIGR